MMADADDFREPAKTTYVALKEAWEQTGSFFWRLGHSFDSVIDYLATVDRTEASDFAELALTKYLEGGGAWYDDFAWWGIAGLRAGQRSDLFGWRSLDFRRFALDSWKTLDGNAPYGWDRADHAKFADYEPLFDGGVWNHIVDDDCNPGPDGVDELCGRQNTVTNALYLVLANRLSGVRVLAKVVRLRPGARLETGAPACPPAGRREEGPRQGAGQQLSLRQHGRGVPARLVLDGRPRLDPECAGGPHAHGAERVSGVRAVAGDRPTGDRRDQGPPGR
jgi:hypothetical protein